MKRRRPGWTTKLDGLVLIGSILITIFLLVAIALMMQYLRSTLAQAALPPTAAVTIIPGPTQTPVVRDPTPTPTLTATADTGLPANPDNIAIGSYVQISGTGGVGLRLRETPGTSGKLLFLGGESEVFQVEDGPQTADNITWWYLVAPYDKERNGWAAANYLAVIQNPNP